MTSETKVFNEKYKIIEEIFVEYIDYKKDRLIELARKKYLKKGRGCFLVIFHSIEDAEKKFNLSLNRLFMGAEINIHLYYVPKKRKKLYETLISREVEFVNVYNPASECTIILQIKNRGNDKFKFSSFKLEQ